VATPVVIGMPYFVGQVVAGDGVAWAFAAIAFAAFVVATASQRSKNRAIFFAPEVVSGTVLWGAAVTRGGDAGGGGACPPAFSIAPTGRGAYVASTRSGDSPRLRQINPPRGLR